MDFNVSKCKVMHIDRKSSGYTYTMAGKQLGKTKEERDIGMMVSNNLKPSAECSKAMVSYNLKPSAECSKASKTAAAVIARILQAFHYKERYFHSYGYAVLYVKPYLEFGIHSASMVPIDNSRKGATGGSAEACLRHVVGLGGHTYEEKLSELGSHTEKRRHQDKEDRESWFKMDEEAPVRTRQAAGLMNIMKP